MTLEERLNVTILDAAKGFSQHLTITVPEPPKEWKRLTRMRKIGSAIERVVAGTYNAVNYLFRPSVYREIKDYEQREKEMRKSLQKSVRKDEEEHNNYLARNGLTTREEQDAWTIAYYAARGIGRMVCREKEGLSFTSQKFHQFLGAAVGTGITIVKEQYWIPVKGVETPEIINADFKESVAQWLCNEVYHRLDTGGEFTLLEHAIVSGSREEVSLHWVRKWPKPIDYNST